MNKKVSDQLVETLVEAGIQRIYAVTGDSLNHVNATIHHNGKIKQIHVRHEETAAYAAGAEAQLNGLACYAGSSGPEHVHLINGLYDAHRSSASVLAIASTIPTKEFGTSFFQETNTFKLFDDCSCYNQVASTPAQLPRMLQAALQHAVRKKGVAILGVLGDITNLPSVAAETNTMLFRNQPVTMPSENELLQLAELLNSHKKVTIFCGQGAAEAVLSQNSVRINNSEIQHKTKDMIVYFYQVNFNNQTDRMLKSLLLFFRKSFTTKTQLILENLYLTKQLEIYQRTDPKLKIKRTDRIFFSLIMDLLSNWKERLFIVKPETVIKWHRTAFKFYWRWKSKPKGGRPKVSMEVINLIKQMANDNPSWESPRIQGELKKLGFDISESTVQRYMPKKGKRTTGKNWKTFLKNHSKEII